MGTPTGASVVAVAFKYRGYREQQVNRTMFAKALDQRFGKVTLANGSQVFRDGYEWCAVFTAYCWYEASGFTEMPPISTGGFYTPQDLRDWRLMGRVLVPGAPLKVGDFVYFLMSNGQPRHVGIVVADAPANSRYFQSIEGNTSPASVINPDGGGVFWFGPGGDTGLRARTSTTVFVRPRYALAPPVVAPNPTKPTTPPEDFDIMNQQLVIHGTQFGGDGVSVFLTDGRNMTYRHIPNPDALADLVYERRAAGIPIDVVRGDVPAQFITQVPLPDGSSIPVRVVASLDGFGAQVR